jgi:murein L,D-transpeptidase YafK
MLKIFNFIVLIFFTGCIPLFETTQVKNVVCDVNDTNCTTSQILFDDLSLNESLESIDAKIGNPIHLRIFKEENILELWVKVSNEYRLCKTYPICSYSGTLGPKLKEGDKQAPEGFYRIYKSQLKRKSKYHLAINTGYPNSYDRARKRTGNLLMIHGGCSSSGCYAMGDEVIEEIYTLAYAALDHGQKFFYVAIFPFRLTHENLELYKDNQWYEFWKNLQIGYSLFEKYKITPKVEVRDKKYIYFFSKKLLNQ